MYIHFLYAVKSKTTTNGQLKRIDKERIRARLRSRAVEKDDGCFVIEKIHRNSQGYAMTRVAGKKYYLHRVVYFLGSTYKSKIRVTPFR